MMNTRIAVAEYVVRLTKYVYLCICRGLQEVLSSYYVLVYDTSHHVSVSFEVLFIMFLPLTQ